MVTQLEKQLGLRLFVSGGLGVRGGVEIEYTAKAQLQLGLQAAWLSLAKGLIRSESNFLFG